VVNASNAAVGAKVRPYPVTEAQLDRPPPPATTEATDMARFFIDRPVFAWVIAIVIVLAGLLAIAILPVERYPDIAPPTITVRATYTGASAQTVENAVTQVIEQSQQSLDHLLYMTSTSASDGSAQVNLVFRTGTDPDAAQVQVQNQLQAAMATLPQSVQQNGLTITKSSGSIFEVVAFTSDDGSMDNFDVANFMESNIDDQISRVNGVGNIQPIGPNTRCASGWTRRRCASSR
jgi:multidrug efflux pump